MQSANAKLERRLSGLERQLKQIKSELKTVRKASRRPWWEEVAGRFKDDRLFDEITEAGKLYRRSLRSRAR